jgi:pilus assembly protein Flp/PilA
MVNLTTQFIQEDEGAAALEYGLLAALIAGVIIVSVQILGNTLDTTFSNVDTKISGGIVMYGRS